MERKTKKELTKIAEELGLKVSKALTKRELISIIQMLRNYYPHKRTAVKDDLITQLKRDGVAGELYLDLVNDYMAMWDVKNMLIEDIETKGVSVRYQNGENQFGYKKNDSVAELQRTNNQMLKLLSHLGLKPSRAEVEEADDDEDYKL